LIEKSSVEFHTKGLLVKGMKPNLIVLFMIASIFWTGQVSHCLAQEQEQALGELRIEGKYIERLILCRKDGRTEQFNEPNETIKLTVGKYRLQYVSLKGGYTGNSLNTSTYDWMTIAENKPAVLKAGAPLKQILQVKRRGRTLIINYKLLGVGGEAYINGDTSNPPGLTVYKGDKEIATGRFAYG
jgi:hypothetical protein